MSRTVKQVSARAANDNAPTGAAPEDTPRGQGAPARYVYVGAGPAAAIEADAPVPRKPRPAILTIATDLPESLPILSGEVALIRGFMADLVARTLANDNDSA
jgi:hypothetical protein